MKPRLLIFTLAVGGALLLSGCTSPGADDDAEVIEMENVKFAPETATIEPGTKVTWINRDSIQHDAISYDDVWSSPLLNGGQTYSYTFDEPGVYEYYCSLHEATMKGTIIVLNEDGSTPTPGDGNEST